MAGEYGYSKIEDLYAGLGYGKFSARQVLQNAAPDQLLAAEAADVGDRACRGAAGRASRAVPPVRGIWRSRSRAAAT